MVLSSDQFNKNVIRRGSLPDVDHPARDSTAQSSSPAVTRRARWFDKAFTNYVTLSPQNTHRLDSLMLYFQKEI